MSLWGRITTGVSHAFSSPVSAIANVATGGLYSVVNENKKASASAAAAGAAAFVTSGGNPIVGAVGAVTGAVNAGINKRSIADSALQSALYGAAEGGVFTGYTALAKVGQAANAAKASTPIYQPFNVATAGRGVAETAAPTFYTPFNVTTAGTGVGQSAGILGTISHGASLAWTGTKAVLKTGVDALGLTAAYKQVFGKPSEYPAEYTPNTIDLTRDGAVLAGLDPQSVPGAANPDPSGYPAPILAGVSPFIMAAILPGGLIALAYWLYKSRKKKHA